MQSDRDEEQLGIVDLAEIGEPIALASALVDFTKSHFLFRGVNLATLPGEINLARLRVFPWPLWAFRLIFEIPPHARECFQHMEGKRGESIHYLRQPQPMHNIIAETMGEVNLTHKAVKGKRGEQLHKKFSH